MLSNGTQLDYGGGSLFWMLVYPELSVQACRCWPRPHIIGLSMLWMESMNCGTRLETDQVMLTEVT